MMSSLALLVGNSSDQNLVKTFFYPRAIEAIWSLLVEYKIISPVKYGAQISAVLMQGFITYCYLIELHCLTPQYYKAIHRFSSITEGEKKTVAAVYACTVNDLKSYYKNHNFE
ncbi:UNKNOWN [Stylonychia lemnae]|uniref:Uncharacterized protein n=1 Tax=Stylonychia lemnae TaxID=5949 RepID=A0A078ASH4_STYLE|nr:UNKNOWN [Stylonychia lemnae]|eukprot:CDW84167.1 UNKNOWN [Stylonychia lemnae]